MNLVPLPDIPAKSAIPAENVHGFGFMAWADAEVIPGPETLAKQRAQLEKDK